MNFLAHIYLSGNSQEIALGNFIADSVKGNPQSVYSGDILKGIKIHRAIDEFTDNHSIVREALTVLYPTQHKYASVVIDIFFDHYLAVQWGKYCDIPLIDYSNQFYGFLMDNKSVLPGSIISFLPDMIAENWLYSYQKISGMVKVFEGMDKRTRFASNMKDATIDLVNHYDYFQNIFDEFFPLLQEFVAELLDESPQEVG